VWRLEKLGVGSMGSQAASLTRQAGIWPVFLLEIRRQSPHLFYQRVEANAFHLHAFSER
jgi:hypothetical protein